MSVVQAQGQDVARAGGVRAAPSVQLESARKLYGANAALDGVTFKVPAGAFMVLLGPSGSGKTTLLRCLAGIERVSSGRIAINGAAVADRDVHLPPERRDLGMVFQDYALWPHLTARQNVEFALRRLHVSRAEAAARTRAMLARVGLLGLADRYPNELSGGEQQRVALARALVANTGLLLFDEPLSNLDANLREQLRIEIATLAREAAATSVYITHDQAEAFALADTIGVLERGRLVQVGPPEAIYAHPADPFVARFTGLAGELAAQVEGPGPAGTAWIRLTGLDGVRLAATAATDVGIGTSGRALIRPASVRIESARGGTATIPARVTDVAFRGRGYDHAVETRGGERLVGIHDERRWARGDAVSLAVDRAGCFFFSESRSRVA